MEEVPENIGPVGIIPLIHWLDAVFSTISKIPLPLLGFGLDLKGHKLVELSSGADASFLNLQTFLPDSCSDLLASESQECFLEYTSAETSKSVNYSLKSQSFTSKKGKSNFPFKELSATFTYTSKLEDLLFCGVFMHSLCSCHTTF